VSILKKPEGEHVTQKTESASILLVEDNKDIAYGLKYNLEFEGHHVEIAYNGTEGLKIINQQNPDIVILDLMMPGMDGYQFLNEIRTSGNSVPVLILSAKGEELDKVRGFRLGADDYVTKPFGTMELIARIEAILRRSDSVTDTNKTWSFGNVKIDTLKHTVHKNGNKIKLTPIEFDLLVALLKRQGAVAPRSELLSEVWEHSGEVITRTVDTHIAELRNKLEEIPSKPSYILTVPKVGYRLNV
jgi:two-component system, OmpR family, alkaline phosphatase synthesis response regulator PhoP